MTNFEGRLFAGRLFAGRLFRAPRGAVEPPRLPLGIVGGGGPGATISLSEWLARGNGADTFDQAAAAERARRRRRQKQAAAFLLLQRKGPYQ